MNRQILKVLISTENDVVFSRQRARQIAGLLSFEPQDQTRIATAVSEIARNAFRYAGRGSIEFLMEGASPPQSLFIRIRDSGPGIPHLRDILDGRYRSQTGMGLGLVGAKRLMDHFDVETAKGKGTTILLGKILPRRARVVGPAELSQIAQTLARNASQSPAAEVLQQNQELLSALDELRRRQEELTQLNQELEDTNRGVVALYAELADKADHLRQADEMKSRFLSNMSHEFRTPLNSVLALSRLLLDRVDGELTTEQEKQVHFIRRSAESLTELVNDLLDLAKVESGKVVVTPSAFSVQHLFGALRGMLRPLLLSRSLNLVFEDASSLPDFFTDEGKLSQILRNLVSNALKFTERGEVRISARSADGDSTEIIVADTGIGIAPEHREVVFQEFAQVDHALQRHVKGTGLGLPLSKKLTELLGGTIALESEPGVGSTFKVTLPRRYKTADEEAMTGGAIDPARLPVLVLEDSDETLEIYEAYLKESPYQVIPARSIEQARAALDDYRLAAVLLDTTAAEDARWEFLADLKAKTSQAAGIPVIATGAAEDRGRALSLGAECHAAKPLPGAWLLDQLGKLTTRRDRKTVLLIDDEDVARYLLRQSLNGLRLNFIEAADGEKGLEMAFEKQPDLIFLDLGLPGISGRQVLETLRTDFRTAEIPVVIVTSQLFKPDELDVLKRMAVSVVSKTDLGGRQAIEKFQSILADSRVLYVEGQA